jgi:hypothetical protein
MPRKGNPKPSQRERGLLSPIVSEAFDLDKQLRVLCYLLAQCFREDQGVDEMIDGIRRMLDNVMESMEPKMLLFQSGTESAPRRKLSSDHHNEVREFIKKMAYSYRILNDISTDEDTQNLEYEGESVENSRFVTKVYRPAPDTYTAKKRRDVF